MQVRSKTGSGDLDWGCRVGVAGCGPGGGIQGIVKLSKLTAKDRVGRR